MDLCYVFVWFLMFRVFDRQFLGMSAIFGTPWALGSIQNHGTILNPLVTTNSLPW